MATVGNSTGPEWESPLKKSMSAISKTGMKPRALNFGDSEEAQQKEIKPGSVIGSLGEAPRESLSGRAKKLSFEESRSLPLVSPLDLNFTTISGLYGVDFFNPAVSEDASQFFQIRDVVLEIERTMQKTAFQQSPALRAYVKYLLSKSNFEEKMTELGMILFFMDAGKPFPDDVDFLRARGNEIEKEVESLLASHRAVCSNDLIPSGKTHYILRAFAHMVVTKDHFYNRGGLLAIKVLLSNPSYKISKYLKHEHRVHILTVLDKMLGQTQFDALFQKKTLVHPDLADAVRLDLKLHPHEEVVPAYVLWDCLMALFADIRQKDAPNCYAISALIYETENHPYKVVSKLLQWLEQGYISLSYGSIPIAPLLEKRLVHSSDLQFEVDREKAFSLPPLDHISATLTLSNETIPQTREPVALKQMLSGLLESSGIPEHLPYAKKLYYAFKYNSLIQLLIAVSEFYNMNAASNAANGQITHSIFKDKLVETIMDALWEGVSKRTDKTTDDFIQKVFGKLGHGLWLVNCSEGNVSRTGNALVVGDHTVHRFAGDLDSLSEVFRDSLRVFLLKGKELVLLHSITELQTAIAEFIKETAKELSLPKKKDTIVQIKEALEKVSTSKNFRITISNCCSGQIQRKGILGKHLNWCDLLLFRQSGGHEERVLDLAFGTEVSRERITDCRTPYQFLEQLLSKLSFVDEKIKSFPKILIATPGIHSWTLTPDCWSLLIKNKGRFSNFVQGKIFNPAKSRMATFIPKETIIRVANRYTDDEALRAEIKEHFNELTPLTYSRFQSVFLSKVRESHLSRLEEIIEDEFSRIVLSKRKWGTVLMELGLKVSPGILNELSENHGMEPALPYHHARDLRLFLIDKGVAVLAPYEIEQAICKASGFPLPIEVGDLNWVDAYSEDPTHVHLVIRYSWIEGTPRYFVRYQKEEYRQSSGKFNTFDLHFPKVAMHREQESW